jgi:hypothetical protein
MGAVTNATRDERLFDNSLTRSASHAERSSMYSISCIFVTACVVDFLSCVPFSISSSIHYRLFFLDFVCLFLLQVTKLLFLRR